MGRRISNKIKPNKRNKCNQNAMDQTNEMNDAKQENSWLNSNYGKYESFELYKKYESMISMLYFSDQIA